MVDLKKKWYVLQTYSGLEDSILENAEKKRDSLNLNHLIGKIIIPEEMIIDAANLHQNRYILSPSAKLRVSNGDEVKKGEVLADEPAVKVRHAGMVKELRNFRKITIETPDGKYTKTYFIPETAKIETGLRVGFKIRQGMPLSKEGAFICEIDGTVVVFLRVKKVLIVRDSNQDTDVYYVPLELYDKNRVKKGIHFKEGQPLSEDMVFHADYDGLVEVVDQGGRKSLKVVKVKRRKLFPGYLFVEMAMTDTSWNAIRSIPNVINFVSSGGAPIPIKDQEARVIKHLAGIEVSEKGEKKSAKVEIDFHLGEVVKIKDGPFADFSGSIDDINAERQELKVMVNIFGRETPVMVHISEVLKI